jgi:hypothetical protein
MPDENKRAQIARDHDDRELIDGMEPAPSHGGSAGGNLKRDVATRAELQHLIEGDDDEAVTRVHGSDKPDKGDRPNLPNRR